MARSACGSGVRGRASRKASSAATLARSSAGVTTAWAVYPVACGNTSSAGSARPVHRDTGAAGAYGRRKPPGRNFTPQTRPRPVSFRVYKPRATPVTSAYGGPSSSSHWKVRLTAGCGTMWEA